MLAQRLVGALAVTTALVAAAPAGATLSGPGVRAGHNVMLFPTIDFVAATGYSVGSPMTVDVVRDGHRIAGVTANTGSTPDGGGLEVNHGPLGAPAPGDCWGAFTPDIRAGDVIRVTADGATDEVTVDNIRIDQGPTAQPGGEVTMQGIAERFDGTPIDLAELNAGEVRNTSRFRAMPNEVLRTPGTTNGWTAVFHAPFNIDRNRNGADPKQSILSADVIGMGFGHVVPLPLETQLADGVGDTPGPALGCEASPGAANAVGTSSMKSINVAGLARAPSASDVALELGGPAAREATAGTVTLTSGGATQTAPAEGLSGGATRSQGWTARFTRAQLDALGDGTLTAGATFTTAAGDVTGVPLTIAKDTVAPSVTTDLAPGTYTGAQRVSLTATGADRVTFRTDGAPATASDGLWTGRAIDLGPGTHTLRTLAVDAAGNSSEASFTYVVQAPAAAAPAPLLAGPALVVARPAAKAPSRSLAVKDVRVKIRRKRATASMTLARGTRVVRLSVYKRLRGGSLELAHRELRIPGRGGAYAVRLKRSLAPGRYVLVATPGTSEARLSATDERSRAFRISR